MKNGKKVKGKNFVVLIMDVSDQAKESQRILDEHGIDYIISPFDSSRASGYYDNPRPPHILTPHGDRSSLLTIKEYAERHSKREKRT